MNKRKAHISDDYASHSSSRKAPRVDRTRSVPKGNSSRDAQDNADHSDIPSTRKNGQLKETRNNNSDEIKENESESSPEEAKSASGGTPTYHNTNTVAQPTANNKSSRSSSSVQPTPSQSINQQTKSTFPRHLTLHEEVSDIFASPPSSILIHACNAQGTWGAGIASAFKTHYPFAYQIYHSHCTTPPAPSPSSSVTKVSTYKALTNHQASLPGTALLIPPQAASKKAAERTKGHFVGCLFTSKGKGKSKDSPGAILVATGPAMMDLLRQIAEWDERVDDDGAENGKVRTGQLVMCKINSGLFGVEWDRTKAVLEDIEVEGAEEDVLVRVVERD